MLWIGLSASMLLYPLCFVPLTAYGWIRNAGHYGEAFTAFGVVTLAGCALLLLSAILCRMRRDPAACVLALLGAGAIGIVLHRATAIADRYGWAPHAPERIGQLASDIWEVRVLPVFVPAALILCLSLSHFFSEESRANRALAKSAADSVDAPKILEDSE